MDYSYYYCNFLTGQIYSKRSGKPVGYKHSTGYMHIKIYNKQIKVHRLVWKLFYGVWPTKELDHIDGNKSNNCIFNLREVSRSENQKNTYKHRNGRLVGTTLHKVSGLWRAYYLIDGVQKSAGYFKTEQEAHAAYLAAVSKLETK